MNEATWDGDTLSIAGNDWRFSTKSAWRITDKESMLAACWDEDVSRCLDKLGLEGDQGAQIEVPVDTTGRYIRVQLNGTGALSLAEVEVNGVPSASNLAPEGSADQSNTGFGGVPTRAIDGNTNGRYDQNSTTTRK